MGTIANLHTLFNRPWYIEQSYGEAHLPLLFNILDGKSFASHGEDKPIIALMGSAYTGSNAQSQQVAVLSIKNPILKYDQECGPKGTKTMMTQLESFKNDPNVAGIVLDIDSGGGQSYGTPEFHDYIKTYPKPVVSYTDGYMASAAYYIGSAASHIIANVRAEAIGSIGAYAQFLDLKGYYEKKGAKLHTIYASKSTEKNKAYRDVLEGNYTTYVKEELDPLVETFHQDMKSVRKNIQDETLKGGTWDGPMALEKGLVDELGTLEDAINKVIELSSNQNSNTNMTQTTKRFAVLGALLSMTEVKLTSEKLFGGKQGLFINEDQLTLIEEALNKQNAPALAVEETAPIVEKTIEEVITPIASVDEALRTLIADAATEVGIEQTEESTAESNVVAMKDLAVKFNQSDASKNTTVFAEKDVEVEENDSMNIFNSLTKND